MSILYIILCLIVFTIVIIFLWEIIKLIIIHKKMFSDASIYEVTENIDNALSEAKFYEYEMMFRTPDCKAYGKFNIHIATKGDKEVIIIDLD